MRFSVTPAALVLVIAACASGAPVDDRASGTTTSTPVVATDARDPELDIALPTLGDAATTELVTADVADIPLPGIPLPGATGTDATGTTSAPDGTGTTASPTTTTAGRDGGDVVAPGPAGAPPAPPFPPSMAAIRGGEQVLLIDTTDGSSAVLVHADLAVDPENQIGPDFPFSVDVDAAAVALRYDTCCDEAATRTHTIDLATGSSRPAIAGSLPSISGDGTRLAVSHVSTIDVIDVASGALTTLRSSQGGWYVGRTSWSVDGAELAIEVQRPGDRGSAIAVVDAAATSLDGARILAPPTGRAWTLPAHRADGAIVVVESAIDGSSSTRIVAVDAGGEVIDTIGLVEIASVLDTDHDATGTWLLVVAGDGDAFWFGPDGAGRLPGGGYTSAAW